MRRIHLEQRWIDYLITQPEQGMSYQTVDVMFADGTQANGATVTNSEWLFVNGGQPSPIVSLAISGAKHDV